MSKFKQILTKVLTAIGAVALVASLAFSGLTYVQKRNLAAQYKTQSDKLATLDGQVKALTQQKQDAEAKAKSLGDQLAALLPENSSLKENMGAFAEQATICEKIRRTLKLGT
ncbi:MULTISPECIES: hypothetical protein [Burkholderiaceae]|uniref:hypothetical protein n=1 Tax=Burkholderiaceae TaxID=119060 RepID=UPI000424AA85|nr:MULTISPECIES: hypothetical protein [Burkholderiaceae]PZR46020.1 MAG: hypothetical protein DI523_18900 [Paraburkholderia fungorum]